MDVEAPLRRAEETSPTVGGPEPLLPELLAADVFAETISRSG